jgi:hypothetical protein
LNSQLADNWQIYWVFRDGSDRGSSAAMLDSLGDLKFVPETYIFGAGEAK